MKITKQTRFITNGKIVIRLGYFSPNYDTYNRSPNDGRYSNCTDYPKGSAAHYISRGYVPEMWLMPKGYMREFHPITRRLLSKLALKTLESK